MIDRMGSDEGTVSRLLGGSPLQVLVKLVVASVLVGMVMAFFGWDARDVFEALRRALRDVWAMGFGAFDAAAGWFLLGIAVVGPIFLVSRLLSLRR